MDDTQKQVPLYQTIPAEIFAFLDSLLMDAGIEKTDSDMYNTMIEELYVRLDKFLIAKIVENLPEEKLEAFAELSETNPPAEKVQEYLAANMDDPKTIFATAFAEFRDLYLTGVKKAQVAMDKEEQTQKAI